MTGAELWHPRDRSRVLGPNARVYPSQPSVKELTHSHVADVMDFGAKGDGTTDDWNAFRLAVLSLVDTGGVIWVPPEGVYKINDSIVIQSAFPVWIVSAMHHGSLESPTGGRYLARHCRFEHGRHSSGRCASCPPNAARCSCCASAAAASSRSRGSCTAVECTFIERSARDFRPLLTSAGSREAVYPSQPSVRSTARFQRRQRRWRSSSPMAGSNSRSSAQLRLTSSVLSQ